MGEGKARFALLYTFNVSAAPGQELLVATAAGPYSVGLAKHYSHR